MQYMSFKRIPSWGEHHFKKYIPLLSHLSKLPCTDQWACIRGYIEKAEAPRYTIGALSNTTTHRQFHIHKPYWIPNTRFQNTLSQIELQYISLVFIFRGKRFKKRIVRDKQVTAQTCGPAVEHVCSKCLPSPFVEESPIPSGNITKQTIYLNYFKI